MVSNLINRLRDRVFLRKHLRDEFESEELRAYFFAHYAIDVGLYSYGCFDVNRIARNTKIGRYCSFARTAHVFNGNHGLDFISLHPYLYNSSLGMVASEKIKRSQCVIGDDVWVGHNSIVLPSVKVVGRGAVIGAGSVVTKNVPAYAVVGGNPAKVIRYRFSEKVIDDIEKSRWWELSREELGKLLKDFPDMAFKTAQYFENK